MKMTKYLAVLFFVFIVGLSNLAYGEIIVKKDGEVIEAKISEKTDNTVWYEKASGDLTEYIGLELSEIEKILNDDGTMSEYSPAHIESPDSESNDSEEKE